MSEPEARLERTREEMNKHAPTCAHCDLPMVFGWEAGHLPVYYCPRMTEDERAAQWREMLSNI